MLHLISSFFSPSGYKLPVENFFTFIDHLPRDAHFTVIELSNKNGDFLLPPKLPNPYHDVIRVNGRKAAVLWQKEKLLNYVINTLPACYDKIAWVDPDLLFDNPNWYYETEKKLDRADIVQPFGQVVRLPKGYRFPYSDQYTYWCDGAFKCVVENKPYQDAMGFSWAAKRSAIESLGGLFDSAIIGGGDLFMLNAITGIRQPWFGGTDFDWALNEYSDRAEKAQLKLDYTEGVAYHLFHGDLKNRNYENRNYVLKKHYFSPYTDLKSNGISWEWESFKPHLWNDVQSYFDTRQEDK